MNSAPANAQLPSGHVASRDWGAKPLTDLPPGSWSGLLVGRHWPHLSSVEVMQSASSQRYSGGNALEKYGDVLRSILVGNLATQEGLTAESNRSLYVSGEEHSRNTATKQVTKGYAYQEASRSIDSLRSALSDIAAAGNSAIDEVVASNAPSATKISAIVSIVSQANSQADMRAALCAGSVYSAIQSILDAEGEPVSARAFAAVHGIDSNRFGVATNLDALNSQVAYRLDELQTATTQTFGGEGSVSHYATTDSMSARHDAPTAVSPIAVTPHVVDETSSVTETAPSAAPTAPVVDSGPMPEKLSSQEQPQPQEPSVAPTSGGTSPQTPAANAGIGPSATASAEIPQTSPSSDDANSSASTEAVDSFTSGNHSGTPVSAGVEAFATVASHPVHAPESPQLNASTPSQVFESPHPAAAPATIASLDISDAGIPTGPQAATPTLTPVVTTTPHVSAFSPTPPTVPQSPLLAYGADLKPAIATPTIATPTVPAAPTSAPVNPVGAATPAGQPTVVRQQQASTAAAQASMTGLTERALAATSTGAATGATAARSAAEDRLRRLLHAVTRQAPQLRWAIGDFPDGSTVLATDLAGGWIPPHIEIPVSVHLISPGPQRNSLAGLLRGADLTATYEPGQRIARDTEPVAMSIRARDTAPVEDLGWELAQATKWRDGLPRLAHTLARAASAKTGFLESEIQYLREHTDAIAVSVLRGYPDEVNTAHVGNWQLMACTIALVNGERSCANYHFAWFQAQTLTREGHR